MLVPQAAEALAIAEAERGRRVLVVVEEAHLLQSDQLEDLRMLGNDAMGCRSISPCESGDSSTVSVLIDEVQRVPELFGRPPRWAVGLAIEPRTDDGRPDEPA